MSDQFHPYDFGPNRARSANGTATTGETDQHHGPTVSVTAPAAETPPFPISSSDSQATASVWDRIRSFDRSPKVVRIASMEINLTAIYDALTAPLRWIWHAVLRLFGGRARSRRGGPQDELKKIKMIRLLALLGFGGAIAGVMIFFIMFAVFSRDLPKPGQVVRREGFSTVVTDREGKVLYDLFSEERRVPVPIDQIPEDLQQATVAIEDKNFYNHRGFDILTPFRIVYNLVFRKRVVGGSTLTQQLVKNVLLTPERTPTRKFKELILALQIERRYSKDQILEMYLNEAPYGGTAWGVGAAAETYFSKPVSELTLVESAILAGLPQSPTRYNPYLGRTNQDGELWWKVRTRGVLARMHDDDYISNIEYEEALAQLDQVQFEQKEFDIKAPHFVFYVEEQLQEMFGEDILQKGGLKVTTSLDLELQDQTQTIVKEEIDKVKNLNITNGSVVIMDPRTGEIISMVGSVDYFSEEIDGQFNVAADGLRQPGSSIKPVTYLSLLQQGFTPSSILVDAPTIFASNDSVDPYEPKNYDGKFRGPVNVRNSLGSSLNITAVKALAIVGVDTFLQNAYDMGFVTLEPTKENQQRFGLAVTLGGAEVHLLDTTTAYSSFANGGKRVEPVSILKVEDLDGNVLFEHKPVLGKQVIDPAHAYLINDILSDNQARSIAFGTNSLLNVSQNIAVKTGTTNDQRDNWAVGWSQEVMVGAWVGNNDNSPMKQVASGVSGATPIWRRSILAALDKGYQAPAWNRPDQIESVELDAISGYPGHDGFPTRPAIAIRGTVPSLPDPIHTKLKVCRGQDKLATDAMVAAGDYEEREYIVLKESDPVSSDGKNRWQEGISAWINGQEDSRYKVPTEYCGEQSSVFIRLEDPKNETKYDSEDIKVKAQADSGDGIEKIEIYVNGSLRETVNSSSYDSTIKLSKGRYEVFAKAYSRSGKTAESQKVKIGTGGEDWKQPNPSPSPSPTPNPSPTPTTTPAASPDTGGPGNGNSPHSN